MNTHAHRLHTQREKAIAQLQRKQQSEGLSDAEKNRLIERLLGENQFLKEQMALAKQKLFASKSEAFPGQGELFNEPEAIQDTATESGDTDDDDSIEYTVKRKKRNPQRFDDHLEREVVIHDIDEDEKVCGCCHGQMHCIGKEVTEKLEFVPATAKVIEHHRLKYACRGCENDETRTPIKIAPPVPAILPKSYATPSLLAQIITSKYQHGLPLYRQEVIFKQLGIQLSRQTMSDWLIKIAMLFRPILYDPWHATLLQQDYVRADETTLKVVNEDKHTCYMWVYNCGADTPEGKIQGDTTPNIVLYDYQPSRAGQCAVNFLGDYKGYLSVDGYAGYGQTQARLVACLAHIRRKFMEAKKAQGKQSKTGKADWALSHIQKLYRIEQQIKGSSIEERYQTRQEKSLPLLNQFKIWLDKSISQVLPESLLGKAIDYALNQWNNFIRYCEDGRIDVDNNRSERAIKPFVIGRKAWLMSQTANGAQASAILYSVIETAKANGLKPYDYLMDVMQKMVDGETDTAQLSPWKQVCSSND